DKRPLYRGIAYLLILSILFALAGPVVQAEAPPFAAIPQPDEATEAPPALPDEDPTWTNEVDSTFLLSTHAPNLPNQLTLVGGKWLPQGPGPAYNGQVENILNKEVVGAIHTVAAHPTNPDILFAGAANGGIWRTDNARSANPTWVPLTDQHPSLSIGALEFDPTAPSYNTLLAGVGRYSSFGRDGGPRAGLLYTINGGATWTGIPGSGNYLVGKNISGVAARGPVFVVSVNDADSFACWNIGLFRSTDTGATWTQVGPPGVAFDLAGDPLIAGDLYSGLTYASVCSGGGLSNGIYKSTDTGATWTKVSNAAMDALIVNGTTNNIEIAAHNGNVFVNIVQNGKSVGIFYSNNGGGTWTQMDQPLLPVGSPAGISNVIPGTPIRIDTGSAHNLSTGNKVEIQGVTGTTGANGVHVITVVSSTQFDLNGTSDSNPYTGGGTWQKVVGMNPTSKPGGQGGIHTAIRVDPVTPTTVYISGDRQDSPFPNYIGALNYTGSLFRGDATIAPTGGVPSPQWDHLTHSNSVSGIPNGGTASSSAPHADSREMVFDASGNLIEVDDGGIYRRTSPQNNTGDWVSVNGNIQVTEMHSAAYDHLSHTIISGNQDTGTTYQPAAGSFAWNSLSTADGGNVAVDNIVLAASNQSVRYSSSQRLWGFRRTVWDANGALVSTSYPALTVTGGGAALVPHFYTPIATDQVAGNRLLIGASNSLYESLDGGNTITEIGPGLVAGRGGIGGNTLAYGGVQAGVPNPDVFYVATGSNVAVRTSSGGGITTYAVPGAGTIRGVAIDPIDWQVAFAIDSDQVFRTTNTGAAWTDITGSMPDTNLRSIAAAPGMLFVGGGQGVYVMDMATGQWYDFGQGLPHVPVWSLDYDDADDVLVAGTLGRGAWLIPINLGGIAVTKTASVGTASAGDLITYTYYLTNTGSVSLTVTATDDRLGAVTLGASSLLPGEVTTGVLTYTVSSGDLPGPLTNTVVATGTFTILGGGLVTDTDQVSVTLISHPAISVTKSANVGNASVGDLITYTYRLTNSGDITLTNVTAADDKLGAVTLFTTTLSPGDSTDGVLTYTVAAGDLPGPLTNTVTVTGTTFTGDDVTASDVATVTLTGHPAISVAKSASAGSASVGDLITYTYRLTNSGDITLTNVVAADDKLGAVTLFTTTLSPGDSTDGVLTYTVAAGDLPGPLTNTVTVTGTTFTGDDVTASDVATVTLTGHPSISVAKSASAGSASVGDLITYTYRLTNSGDITLTNVTAADDKLGAVTLLTTTLAPGDSTDGVLAYTVVTGDLPGPLVNTVTVTGTPLVGNDVTASDTATVTLNLSWYIYLPLVLADY
ncbi:MAG TPA: hypothetical protein ENJ31_09045, partial [Anaerolineae bacterium]|nr:hypothetical protein [Anaerolineae bacterium]